MKLPVDFAIVLIVLIQLTDALDKEKVHHSKWLNVESAENETAFYMFDWLVKVSVQKCVDACKATKACQYINHDVRANKCVLIRRNDDLDSNDEPVVETKPGHMFGNKSEWVNHNLSQCDKCANYGECYIDGSSDSKYRMCRNSGCRQPPKGVDFLGNSFAAGCSIRLKYDGGQVFPPRMTCLENGTWGIDQSVCTKYPNTRTCFNGSYYFVESNRMTWHDAKRHCESLWGHLVDVNTDGEQMFLKRFLTQENVAIDNGIWTGGNALETKGDFRWSDGSEFSVNTHWLPGEPNNDKGAEDCVHLWKIEYEWNDENCNMALPSVCELPINYT